MKFIGKISLFLLLIIALSFFALVFGGCKSYYKSKADAAMWKAYSMTNDTIVARQMALELNRLKKQAIGSTFQVIGIEHKAGYNVVNFQFMYDGGFLGGSLQLYLNPDSAIRFRQGSAYFIDFIPQKGGEPIGAPNDK